MVCGCDQGRDLRTSSPPAGARALPPCMGVSAVICARHDSRPMSRLRVVSGAGNADASNSSGIFEVGHCDF